MKKLSIALSVLVFALIFTGEASAQGRITRFEKQKTESTKNRQIAKSRSPKAQIGSINGHDYVDLGLPSGLKWATCNVGATKPEEYGDYYSWGETDPKIKYDLDSSKTFGQKPSELKSNGICGSSGSLKPLYDSAYKNWGGTWRMPTRKECQELIEKCSWKWTTQDGIAGYRVVGPNGGSIFLPAAGTMNRSDNYTIGEAGSYYSSTPYADSFAYSIFFGSGYKNMDTGKIRSFGCSVRPVSE